MQLRPFKSENNTVVGQVTINLYALFKVSHQLHLRQFLLKNSFWVSNDTSSSGIGPIDAPFFADSVDEKFKNSKPDFLNLFSSEYHYFQGVMCAGLDLLAVKSLRANNKDQETRIL